MNALRIISDEHQSLAAVLHAIRFMLKEASLGTLEPDIALFGAMVHYLEAFAEQRHHPKEDRLFAALKAHTGDGAAALSVLDAEHAAAPQRIAALKAALAAFVADPRRIEPFAEAFNRYADFYRGHMLLEEEVLLPLARRHLTAEDWQAVDRAFAADEAQPAPEDFAALFTKLVDCAPEPIGRGLHAFPDAS